MSFKWNRSPRPRSPYEGIQNIGDVLRPRLEPGSHYVVIAIAPSGYAEIVTNLRPEGAAELLRDIGDEMDGAGDPVWIERN